jgi:thiamine biosynthesis protein ThiS
MITLTINGDRREVPEGLTLATLLTHLGLDPRMVVVEQNRVIVRKTAIGEARVAAGDEIEIVHFVGGG